MSSQGLGYDFGIWVAVVAISLCIEGTAIGLSYARWRYKFTLPEWIRCLLPEIWMARSLTTNSPPQGQSRANDIPRQDKSGHMMGTQVTSYTSNMQTMVPLDAEMAIPGFLQVELKTDYKVNKVIVRGGAGSIAMGEIVSEELIKQLNGTTIVIVKQLHAASKKVDEVVRATFLQEVSMMWYFNSHPNFAKIYGYNLSQLTILMRHYPLGSLASVIFQQPVQSKSPPAPRRAEPKLEAARDSVQRPRGVSSREKSVVPLASVPFLTTATISSLVMDIASGLKAMHARGIVHNDIKPDNILLEIFDSGDDIRRPSIAKQPLNSSQPLSLGDGTLRAMLTDFGISQFTNTKDVNIVNAFQMVKIQGASTAYASPECFIRLNAQQQFVSAANASDTFVRELEDEQRILNTPPVLKAGDIYSMAVTVFDMINQKRAWRHLSSKQEIESAVYGGGRPEFCERAKQAIAADPQLQELVLLMRNCWQQEYMQRPQADAVVAHCMVMLSKEASESTMVEDSQAATVGGQS